MNTFRLFGCINISVNVIIVLLISNIPNPNVSVERPLLLQRARCIPASKKMNVIKIFKIHLGGQIQQSCFS